MIHRVLIWSIHDLLLRSRRCVFFGRELNLGPHLTGCGGAASKNPCVHVCVLCVFFSFPIILLPVAEPLSLIKLSVNMSDTSPSLAFLTHLHSHMCVRKHTHSSDPKDKTFFKTNKTFFFLSFFPLLDVVKGL